MLLCLCTAANVADRVAGEELLAKLNRRENFPRLAKILGDNAYKNLGSGMRVGVSTEAAERLKGQKGFVPQIFRWAVERTFAWLNRNRRLVRNYEKNTKHQESMNYIANARLCIRRLEKCFTTWTLIFFTASKTLVWAQGEQANVKEPIQELKEHGWRYGDVPKASNFNWLFKTMTEEMTSLRKDLLVQKEELLNTIADQAQKQEEKLSATARKLLQGTVKLVGKHHQSYNLTSWQIVACLREMEKLIQHHHPEITAQPWPTLDPPTSVRGEEDNQD